MKLHTFHNTVTLVGTLKEFSEIIGHPEGTTSEALQELALDAGLYVNVQSGKWRLSGNWRQFADFIGYPEATDLSNFSMAFKRIHPEVEITPSPA